MLHEGFRVCRAAEEQHDVADAGKQTMNFSQTQACKTQRGGKMCVYTLTRKEIVTERRVDGHFSIQAAALKPH